MSEAVSSPLLTAWRTVPTGVSADRDASVLHAVVVSSPKTVPKKASATVCPCNGTHLLEWLLLRNVAMAAGEEPAAPHVSRLYSPSCNPSWMFDG